MRATPEATCMPETLNTQENIRQFFMNISGMHFPHTISTCMPMSLVFDFDLADRFHF